MMTAVEGMYGGLSALADTLQVRTYLIRLWWWFIPCVLNLIHFGIFFGINYFNLRFYLLSFLFLILFTLLIYSFNLIYFSFFSFFIFHFSVYIWILIPTRTPRLNVLVLCIKLAVTVYLQHKHSSPWLKNTSQEVVMTRSTSINSFLINFSPEELVFIWQRAYLWFY